MSLRLCLILCLAPLTLANGPVTVNPQALQDVFGAPELSAVSPALSPFFIQARPVSAFEEDRTEVSVVPMSRVEPFVQSTFEYDGFDWILTKRVAMSSNDNFLLSPLGLKLALAILTEAATGQTQTELSAVLGFDLNRVAVRRKFSTILGSLNSQSTEYILNLGSRIYLDDYVHPQQRFAAIAEEFYMTEFAGIDFNNASFAAKDINSWVKNKTSGHIDNLVNEGDLKGVVALVLTTLYFKGTWVQPFAAINTTKLSFYVSPTEQKDVPFMNIKGKFFYTESTEYDAKILRLPYAGNKFSMYLVVPNTLTGLPRVLQTLTAKNLRTELFKLSENLVDVSMPKFQFDYTSVLNSVLQELGVRQAFEDTASLPGIARGQMLRQKIKISNILQRCGIEVNELGSTAYAATEVLLETKFGEGFDNAVEFTANRPFAFFIQDEATRQVLFTGRVSNPLKADGAFKFE